MLDSPFFMQVVSTNFGLEVLWDGRANVDVRLVSDFNGKTCGLLGNFNGDENDDYMQPDSQIVS